MQRHTDTGNTSKCEFTGPCRREGTRALPPTVGSPHPRSSRRAFGRSCLVAGQVGLRA